MKKSCDTKICEMRKKFNKCTNPILLVRKLINGSKKKCILFLIYLLFKFLIIRSYL